MNEHEMDDIVAAFLPTASMQFLHSMEIRNATYMRQNTIELRRIAEQSQAESEHAKKQAELSAKNSIMATRIAILTMIFLPPTFIAV